MNQAYSTVITGGLMLSLGLSGGRALAQGKVLNCSDLPNPIYMSGTTAVEPLVRRFGAKLDQLAVKQTLLWNNNTDGCSSVGSLAYGDQTFLNKSTFQY